jgi:hypothetical protein
VAKRGVMVSTWWAFQVLHAVLNQQNSPEPALKAVLNQNSSPEPAKSTLKIIVTMEN